MFAGSHRVNHRKKAINSFFKILFFLTITQKASSNPDIQPIINFAHSLK